MGFLRFLLRLNYEFRKIIDQKIPKDFIIGKHKIETLLLEWKDSRKFNLHNNIEFPTLLKKDLKKVKFNFLNDSKVLDFPFRWNNKDWERLWQFNLHYFEWARDIVELSLVKNKPAKDLKLIEPLIDSWIDYNPIGHGDGWHSYTLSLRIRNWIWLFRTFPHLKNLKRITSLWHQIIWLYKHKEKCHGGNHYLENLISLIIGSLQFENSYGEKIYTNSLTLLKRELKNQILIDGGHQERSAAYHILILDRLIELAIIIDIHQKINNDWLIDTIKIMTNWLENILIQDKIFPIFNDSSPDTCPDINQTIMFAKSYLDKKPYLKKGFRGLLLNNSKKINSNSKAKLNLNDNTVDTFLPGIKSFKNTGWILFNHKNGYDLAFKCGKPCPNHLPAHAHSDQLTFDLWKKGIPIICETGVSTYKKSKRRHFERSIVSHNSIQLGLKKNKKIKWLEPLEIWDSFRAGRKSNRTGFEFGIDKNWLWLSGQHDGYKNLVFSIKRTLCLNIDKNGNPILIVFDTFKNKVIKKNYWRTNFHMSKKIEEIEAKDNLKWFYSSNEELFVSKKKGYYSRGFNLRKEREIMSISGKCNSRNTMLIYVLTQKDRQLKTNFEKDKKVELILDSEYSISLSKDSKPLFRNL